MTEADAYMELARAVIPMARYPYELRDWWKNESAHRAQYDLSTAQWDELVALCKARVDEIARDGEDSAVA